MKFIRELFKSVGKGPSGKGRPGGGIVTVYLGLGSNLGDSMGYINNAVKRLEELENVSVADMSRVVHSRPLGGKRGPDYLNAVLKIRTKRGAEELLDRTMLIEESLGRVRGGERWGSRTIDIDMLLYGDRIIESARLRVPHEQMHLRSFVMDGMCDLDGDLVHPEMGRTMRELRDRLNGGDFFLDPKRAQLVCIGGVIGVGKTTLAEGLARELGAELIKEAYDKNPYLEKVYRGQKEYALDSQLFFLNSRVEQLDRQRLGAGKRAVCDYVFEKELIFANRTLEGQDREKYKDKHSEMRGGSAEPVLAIYMHDRADGCVERIKKRSRPFEQGITADSLEGFCEDYERLFSGWKKCPLIRLDAGEFDCTDAGQVRELGQEVRRYIC